MEIEKIHNYISGKLSPEEQTSFETKIANDPALEKEVLLQQNMLEHIQATNDSSASQDLIKSIGKEFLEESANKQPKIKTLAYALWVAAAAIAMLVLFNLNNHKLSEGEIFDKYFNPPVASFASRGDANQNLLEEAEVLFNQKEYEQSNILFKRLLSESSTIKTSQIKLYYAISLIESNELSKAKNLLQELIGMQNNFTADATWYLALAELKEGNKENALNVLSKITGSYQTKAQDLAKHIRLLE